jgi:hypothetical protein
MKIFCCSCFKKFCCLWVVAIGWGVAFSSSFAAAEQQTSQNPCSAYSDHFDIYNPERWQEVLLYSKARGAVAVEKGWLTLSTPKDEPCEIQVYSLFCFEGDFDIQADYDFSTSTGLPSCRFNTGLVMQTLDDEKSFKFYLAAAQKEAFFFRGRLDASGENNLEKFKGDEAPQKGVIRIVRKAGQVSFLTLQAGTWHTLHTFIERCDEKLRVRFKLQTSGDEEGMLPCPVTVKFDNFRVNACEKIIEE